MTNLKMSEMDPELNLIREVKKHDCLYDKNSYNFKNHVKKDEVWLAIANNVGLAGKIVLFTYGKGWVYSR